MREPFPFWPLALSIATGMLIANAVTWFATETRLRYELHQVASELEAQQKASAVENQAQQAERRERLTRQYEMEFKQKAERDKADAERQAKFREQYERDQIEGEYFRSATDDLPPGTFACRDRQIVKRTPSGWEVATLGTGEPAKCRTVR